MDLVGVPAALCNDAADVAGLAEAPFGRWKRLCRRFSTSRLVAASAAVPSLMGQIYRGVGRGVAEIGHYVLE